MNANQLLTILSEYRPSTPLRVLVDGQVIEGTPATVVEMMLTIKPTSGLALMYRGRGNIIVRERTKHFSSPKAQPDLPMSPPFSDEWIELDIR